MANMRRPSYYYLTYFYIFCTSPSISLKEFIVFLGKENYLNINSLKDTDKQREEEDDEYRTNLALE